MRWPLLLIAGCTDPEVDRAAYLDALHADGSEAAAACARITSPGLRGDCTIHAAAALASQGHAEQAVAACDGVPDTTWRDECHFLVTDELALLGDPAIAACERTGPFRHDCIGHVIGRELVAIEAAHGAIGDEVALQTAIRDMVERYEGGAPQGKRVDTALAMTAKVIAARWDTGPMDATRCGAAPEALCVRAYLSVLDADAASPAVQTACERGIDLPTALSLGARPWTSDSEAVALRAWRQLCRTRPRRRGPKDGERSVGLLPTPVAPRDGPPQGPTAPGPPPRRPE